MFYALGWFVVASLIALWSLSAWALHAVAVWAVSNAGALSGAAATAGTLDLPPWLSAWVPPEIAQWMGQLLTSLGPLIADLLQAAPALAGGVTVAAWVIWAMGSVLLVLLLGIGLHLFIAVQRRRRGQGMGMGRPLAAHL